MSLSFQPGVRFSATTQAPRFGKGESAEQPAAADQAPKEDVFEIKPKDLPNPTSIGRVPKFKYNYHACLLEDVGMNIPQWLGNRGVDLLNLLPYGAEKLCDLARNIGFEVKSDFTNSRHHGRILDHLAQERTEAKTSDFEAQAKESLGDKATDKALAREAKRLARAYQKSERRYLKEAESKMDMGLMATQVTETGIRRLGGDPKYQAELFEKSDALREMDNPSPAFYESILAQNSELSDTEKAQELALLKKAYDLSKGSLYRDGSIENFRKAIVKKAEAIRNTDQAPSSQVASSQASDTTAKQEEAKVKDPAGEPQFNLAA